MKEATRLGIRRRNCGEYSLHNRKFGLNAGDRMRVRTLSGLNRQLINAAVSLLCSEDKTEDDDSASALLLCASVLQLRLLHMKTACLGHVDTIYRVS